MFERLVSKLLSDLLSKYFTEDSLAKNKVTNAAQLGVWSGYISLSNLQLKKDVVNSILNKKGQPFELVQCSFRQVEITIPWAKLSSPIQTGGSREDAVVVLVLDGVHVLLKTSFDFNDLALRTEEIEKRRTALKEAGSYIDNTVDEDLGFSDSIKKRITDGLLQEIADNLHVHVRDLHVRLEDVESNPNEPYACGITMESMHIQQNDEAGSDRRGVVKKVVQLNHFASYWNICDYGPDLPVENAVLHQTSRENSEQLSRSLNFCIPRRGSIIASPSRNPYIPTHSYILLPVDGMMDLNLSRTPNDLRVTPALEATITLDSVSTQIRDFQCVQMLRLQGEFKNHMFVKQYRRFRPLVSINENARAWWFYAARVIRYQLKENFVRSSVYRFAEGYNTRRRYMDLYKRKLRFPSLKQEETLAIISQLEESDILDRSRQPRVDLGPPEQLDYAAPDAGAGPSAPPDQNPLNYEELVELQNYEDGILGDLSVDDVMLFRAIVNMRLGRTRSNPNGIESSWWKTSLLRVADDSEAREEFERLLQFVEEKKDKRGGPLLKNRHQTAVSVMLRFEEVSVSLFSPSHLTAGEAPLRRLHEKFLDFKVIDIRSWMSLQGDYKTIDYQLSIFDVVGAEIRSDRSQHVFISQLLRSKEEPNSADVDNIDEDGPLLLLTLTKNPPSSTACDVELVVGLKAIDLKFAPECQWIGHFKDVIKQISRLPNVAEYWEDLSLAYLNSRVLGRLGLLTKAESVAEEHQNIDIDVTIQCPVIQIGDGHGCDLVVDLGTAYFKTAKLAGVSRAQLHDSTVLTENPDATDVMAMGTTFDDGSAMGSLTGPTKYRFELSAPRRKKSAFSVSSAMSVGSRAGRNRSLSLHLDDAISFQNGGNADFSVAGKTQKRMENQQLNEVFYDVYIVRLQTGRVRFNEGPESFDISSGFQISTTLKKSIIPSDHTICKLKANTVVEKLDFDLNDRAIFHLGKTVQTWRRLAAVDIPSSRMSYFHHNTPLRGTLHERSLGNTENRPPPPIEADLVDDAGSFSQIDEREFFDANDGYDSFGDGSGVWFDDHWVADAESVIELDSRSLRSERKGRRKRSTSMSEVSSTSENSGKALKNPSGVYLSAENLAKLEEGMSEDDGSFEDSRGGSDDDSFHSVMSTRGQRQVLNDLEENIKDAEAKIMELSNSLEDMSLAGSVSDFGSQGDQKERRQTRKVMKLRIRRAKAELNVLIALRADLLSLLDEVPGEGITIAGPDYDEGGSNKVLIRSLDQQAKAARAIMEAKEQRDATTAINGPHNLTQHLNRELFQGSVLLDQIQITIHLGGRKGGEPSQTDSPHVFQLILSQTAFAVSHHVHDTKVYFSMDQMTFSIGDKHAPSRLLLSCGSPDTLLPSHFPHLISRSMEEKFIRGTLHTGKRRCLDGISQVKENTKLRLVLGDVEVSPQERYLSPLVQFLSTMNFDSSPPAFGKDAPPYSNGVASDSMAKSSHSSTNSKCLDLAVRLTSVRLVLSYENKVVGAFGVTELSTRFVQIGSAPKSRLQVDLQCTNIQFLEIGSLLSGHGGEILGRRDPYSFIVQLRGRSQLVPAHETGGWVVGIENRNTEMKTSALAETVRNMHVGLRLNPVSLVASPTGVSMILQSGREMKRLLVAPTSVRTPLKAAQKELRDIRVPLRWRIDVSLRRIAVYFPEDWRTGWNVTDDAGSKMMVGVTAIGSLQESVDKEGFLDLQLGMTDISVVRQADELTILEPFAVLCGISLKQSLAKHGIDTLSGVSSARLFMPQESPLNEIAEVMRRHEWKPAVHDQLDTVKTALDVKVTPIRMKLSAPIIGLMVDTMSLAKEVLSVGMVPVSEPIQMRSAPHPDSGSSGSLLVHLLVEEVECPAFMEVDSKAMSNTKPVFSFTMTGMTIEYNNITQTGVSILIRNLAFVDFSSVHGIRVIGEDPTDQTSDNLYFVRLKLCSKKNENGANVIGIHVNWGRLQCLVLPTFVASLLTLQNDVNVILQNIEPTPQVDKRESDILGAFLGNPKDMNLMMTADAEAFELILPSRDIVEYVKNAETNPIGVVSFRWKASLSVAMALDRLKEDSVPWVTLDLDGSLSDKKDRGLFKDFADRYLAQSSGFLAGADETGHKLINAFTARVRLGVVNFQVLRTDIAGVRLDSSSLGGVGGSHASKTRLCFKVSPPSAGEQRITNPIDLDLSYRAVGASMSGTNIEDSSSPSVEVSQLLELNATKTVDILLYISHGERGWTEAVRVTIKPILDLLKKKEARRKPATIQKKKLPEDEPKGGLSALVKSASSLCSIRLEGFQVTCVPGGATNLNESPIIRFELSGFSSGLACLPVRKDARQELVAGRSRAGKSESQQLLPGYDVMHLTASGWVDCEISAHYHNRRLVAWEPFIEPWAANLRFGANLVEVLKIPPLFKQSGYESSKSSFDPWILGNLNEGPTEKLKDFGRLFRAPFQSAASKPSHQISQTDFCYLMLASTARSTILSVQYPLSDSHDRESRLFLSLPGQDAIGWLHGFGFPDIPRKDHRTLCDQFSVSFLLSDRKPLNINLTGALIENVLGYLDNTKKEVRTIAPHWIRNESGMTIRLQEVLDTDRIKRGEHATKTELSDGSEVPLTLKRSLSQSCDPHRAYIHLELGSFEDTIGRINHDEFEVSKGSRSSSFFFKAAAKIPVDMVGVHRYPLDRNIELRADTNVAGADTRSLGWIIVRVALKGGTKVVSVESPFVIKSSADSDLLCEVRDHSGLSIVWRCLVPKAENRGIGDKQSDFVSVPADIVPFVHDESYSFSVLALARDSPSVHEGDFLSDHRKEAIEITAPPPFSPQSFRKGLIEEKEIVLATISPNVEDFNPESGSEHVHLSVCSVRIGSFAGVNAGIEIPEQRMIFFRSPLVIRNYLSLPIFVQVRVKYNNYGKETATGSSLTRSRDQTLIRRNTVYMAWEDLGVLDCGQSVNWTGALSADKVQIRVRFVGLDGDNSRRYPGWSSAVSIPMNDENVRRLNIDGNVFANLRVVDADNIPLDLSVALATGNRTSGDGMSDNIRQLSDSFSSATRVVSIFVPYWIIDSTNEDFEFFAGAPVPGQLDKRVPFDGKSSDGTEKGTTQGLAELLDNENFLNLPLQSPFSVRMIGERSATRLTIRKRVSRKSRRAVWRHNSPWSDPVPLYTGRTGQHDTTVISFNDPSKDISEDQGRFDRFVLRSSIMPAPTKFGGNLGTMLIHVVNRYGIINEIGRDIEIVSDLSSGTSLLVRATSRPQPFHFDDSKPIRFRFKEFGWDWSGKFNVRMNRREVTMRLRHPMKGETVIVTFEVRVEKKSSTCLLIFRESSHPPFRLENHTMYPLHFGQSSTKLASQSSDIDAMLLPYQNVNFAWDQPELRRRALVIRSSGLANGRDFFLGRFYLDRLAPGTNLKLNSSLFTGEVVADGPTRVLRITDAAMPHLSGTGKDEMNDFHQKQEGSAPITISLMARLSSGLGISVVDWSPQELLYARLDDIQIERSIDQKKDAVTVAIGNIKLNNQLWVTPYPVLLKMGRRSDLRGSLRRNRKHDAISLSWRRPLTPNGGYGNVTLLERVELSSQPIFANVDGNLAGLLFRMMEQIGGITSDNTSDVALSRDDELKNILSVVGNHNAGSVTTNVRKAIGVFDLDGDGELLTTAAVAAKLKTRPLPLVSFRPELIRRRKEKREPLSKPKPKYYIERMKISATKADLSWSGPLPGRVSNLLFRALTFERLPLRLRPYSSSYAYGNSEDHIQALKSHYLSFWRILDLLMGLTYNPTFLSRAVVYTCRESIASSLEALSQAWTTYAKKILRLLPEPVEFQPTYDDGLPIEAPSQKSSDLKKAILGPFARSAAFSLRCASSVTTWLSSLLKYGPGSSKQLATRGMARSRNPRVFAHVEGKDLLVEYVEGENSGKALLSRVRMGMHLSEGYIFHTEEARRLRAKSTSAEDYDQNPLILMMTSERVFLLNGKPDAAFCSVEWEAPFLNLIHVEILRDLSSSTHLQAIVLWYLSDAKVPDTNGEEAVGRNPSTISNGLHALESTVVFVPVEIVSKVADKMMHAISHLDMALKK
eukprot:scaffold2047_cov129-Cylindrotheca_fusiformis.AAC.20